jgi:hypothetical protein
VAVLTVSYKHWLEHRGSEGLADFLENTANESAAQLDNTRVRDPNSIDDDAQTNVTIAQHPGVNTTPDEMARVRPDLTTGELKVPLE